MAGAGPGGQGREDVVLSYQTVTQWKVISNQTCLLLFFFLRDDLVLVVTFKLLGLMGRSISTATNMTVTTTFSTASGECSETRLFVGENVPRWHSASKKG